MQIKGYDEWKLATPWDDEPDLFECGEDDCTCDEERALEMGDWLYERKRDREIDNAS